MPYPVKKTESQEMSGRVFEEEIYARYKHLIVYILRKYLFDYDMVEDLTQTVLVKLYQVKDLLWTLSPEKRTAYVVATAQYAAYDYNERSGNEQKLFVSGKLSDSTFQIADPKPSVEDAVIKKETLDYCRRELEKLPEHEKMLLYGKYFLRLSDEELAKRENCKPESIRMKMTRARRLAKKLFEEKGVDNLR